MAFNSFCLERDVGESQAESDRVMEAQSTSKVKNNTQTAAAAKQIFRPLIGQRQTYDLLPVV